MTLALVWAPLSTRQQRILLLLPMLLWPSIWAVHGLDWCPGDEVLASNQEYGAIDNCLHLAERRRGVVVKRAQIPVSPERPEDILNAFYREFTDRTKLVLCSHITTGTGLITPIKALARLAQRSRSADCSRWRTRSGHDPAGPAGSRLRLLRRQLSQMAVRAQRHWIFLCFACGTRAAQSRCCKLGIQPGRRAKGSRWPSADQ